MDLELPKGCKELTTQRNESVKFKHQLYVLNYIIRIK